jgi:hypothetical protein
VISQIDILRSLKDKEIFETYGKLLKEHNFEPESWLLFQDFKAYFESFPSDKKVIPSKFSEWFFHLRHPDLQNTQRQDYKLAIESLELPANKEFSAAFLQEFKRQSSIEKIKTSFNKGEFDVELIKKELAVVEHEDTKWIQETKVNLDVEHVFESVGHPDKGFKWHLQCLNNNCPPIDLGIFTVIAALRGTGKSSMLAHLVAKLLPQINTADTPLKGRPILWLNNENKGERSCGQRVYEAYFNKRSDEIRANYQLAREKFSDKGYEKLLYCHEIHGRGKKDVELLIKHYNPSLLIIDMLDGLAGFETKQNVVSDQKFRNMYQWALDISCETCPIVATSQLSDGAKGWVNGEYIPEISMYPDDSFLIGARSAKAEKASLIIKIGVHNSHPDKRYFSATRNKYGNEEFKATVEIDKERSRYIE